MCGHFTVVSDNLKPKKANGKIKEWREDRDKDGEKSWKREELEFSMGLVIRVMGVLSRVGAHN